MQKMIEDVLVDNVVSCCVDWESFFLVVCCKLIKLKVVWCVLALQRTKNNSTDGLYFDALHVFWIWQAWQKEVEDNIDEERGGMTT
jgi:hypothetical protein